MSERTVLTIGTFDTPHIGHAYLFRECERFGKLVVGINSDEFVEKYKGRRPLFSYEERSTLISTLGYTVIKNSSAGRECIEQVNPDILAIGSDWARKDYYSQIDVDQDFMDENNITMIYIPRVPNISSTEIKSRV
jgi:glycerol-3-phosphate cytidylyltransferase